jgi:predicted nucleotidyltransferase
MAVACCNAAGAVRKLDITIAFFYHLIMLTGEQIQTIIDQIKLKSNPSRIYLFGSYAHGHPRADSDLDLLVIKKNIPDKLQELIWLKKELISADYSLDILLYSEEEFTQKKQEGWAIFKSIEKNGKLCYAA